MSDDLARAGLRTLQQPQQTTVPTGHPTPSVGASPAAVAPFTQTPLDLATMGLEESDPASKAVRAMERMVASQNATITQLQASLDGINQSAKERQLQSVLSEAEGVVASFNSQKYGIAGNRTALQEMAISRLYNLADAIAIGAVNRGQQIPPVSVRLAQARLLDGDVPPPNTAGGGALPQRTAVPDMANPELKMTERWSENPALLRAIARI
jgi:hypothetical protein